MNWPDLRPDMIAYRAGGLRQQYRNWLSRRARDRGKVPLPDRVTRTIGARTPVVRDRINPGTGRPRRDDIELTRSQGRALAQFREKRDARGMPDAHRSGPDGGREFR
jgi:hypothetical protein